MDKSNPISDQTSNMDTSYEVLSPLGDETIEDISMAPRLNTLDGKTICLIANGSFKSNVTLSVIAELLLKKYPDAKVIPYTEMPRSFKAPAPGTKTVERTGMEAAFREIGCEVVISGNGG